MINSAKWLAMSRSFRGNAIHIALLSSLIWLTTQTSSIASLSPNQLETQDSSYTHWTVAQHSHQAHSRNPVKRIKASGYTRLPSIHGLNSLAAPSGPSDQSWTVISALNRAAPETHSSVAMEPPPDPNSENSEALDAEVIDSEIMDLEAMDNGGDPAIEGEGSLDLSPELIEGSPTLQRWLQEVPDLLSDIAHDPSFRPRLRAGFSQFPSTDQTTGFHVGVEDVFVGRTGLTVSGDYYQNGGSDRQSYGVDLRYYLLSLGSRLNVAPVVGYRYLKSGSFNTDGVNLGIRLLVVPSRTGAADISLTQTWISPTSSEEVGVTTLSLGYAMTHDLRISTDIQVQNSPIRHDSRVGISLEWML